MLFMADMEQLNLFDDNEMKRLLKKESAKPRKLTAKQQRQADWDTLTPEQKDAVITAQALNDCLNEAGYTGPDALFNFLSLQPPNKKNGRQKKG